jgi:putative membrane protein insertion efficiency factor
VTERQDHPLRELAVALLLLPLRLYQWLVSPLFPPACRFEPTCSHYAVEALKVHGPWRGLGLAARRLLRCHPFTSLGGSSGYDPVPPIRS